MNILSLLNIHGILTYAIMFIGIELKMATLGTSPGALTLTGTKGQVTADNDKCLEKYKC